MQESPRRNEFVAEGSCLTWADGAKVKVESGISRRSFLKGACILAGSLLAGSSAVLSGCGLSDSRLTRTVIDMYGREVKVPEEITRVFCTNPIGTVDVYTLSPDSLVGWNFLPAGDNRKYISQEALELPALGVWMGAGAVPNTEEIAKQDPDVLLCYWTCDDVGAAMADDIAETTGLPVLLIDYDIRNTPEMMRYVGQLIGREERAEELAAYSEEKLDLIKRIVENIPEDERKSIFLAQGTDGLTTDPVGSMHVTDALELIGVENVADMPGTEGQGMGMPSVNLEQIMTWDPDAVLVAEFNMSNSESSDIYSGMKEDPHWLNVPCVAEGEIYRIPQGPFSWFGRPPSVARLLGCLWLLKILYPTYSQEINLEQEVRDFYNEFYGYDDLDDETLHAMLQAARASEEK